ncbi:MAG: aspartate--tRNA ligase, partial [Treponema sp.]|nr:aspartate--tRNA ligase [Treponema sp.]
FTQIDIEMSFTGREEILSLVEGCFGYVFKKTLSYELPAKFRRLTYEQAMEMYGSDKPDLRFGMVLQDFAPWVAGGSFQAFKDALNSGEEAKKAAAAKGITIAGGGVKAMVVPGSCGGKKIEYSRKQIEELEAQAKVYKAKGLAWMKVAAAPAGTGSGGSAIPEGGPVLEGGVSKFFADQAADIIKGLGAAAGDLILIVADSNRKIANVALGAVRSKLGRDLNLGDPKNFEFAWIIDFPLFEFNEEENHWEAAHHMFSYPQEQYHDILEKDPGSVKGDLYDLVLNGFELASGSIRIHDPELQKRIFNIVGYDPAEAQSKFGFLLDALKYGAPPHGGIAPGIDRPVMPMAGETTIREVIAFPKNSFAQGLMDGSPNEVSKKQLEELHLSVTPQAKP